ncbi:MAG: PQQ-like beta-propeller repeat protein [Planctomycetes bacterium]|nr:PQQ-like beta-propeller repeat protein [Planctomycetota bacterium]
MRLKTSILISVAVAWGWTAGFVGLAAGAIDPMDWPNWRGPQQNSVSTEKGLIESWDPDGGPGSNLLWKSAELAGRSTPIVMRGKLYTIVRDRPGTATEGEKVVCVDPATGEILWEHRFNVYLSEVPDSRVGWSSCAGDPETGRVYAQGVSGYFCCLEGDTGKVVWDRSLHEEFGLISTFGGRTNIPIVFEDTVLVSAVVVGWGDEPKWGGLARPAHRFMAFDKATGELRWLNGTSISPFDTTYSTPTVMPIGGQAALVFGSGDGQVWAMQPRTGKQLWHLPLARMGLNASPLVTPDGRVFMSHSEENTFGNTMGTVVEIDGTKLGDQTDKELWRQFEVMAGKSSPILIDDRLYVVDDFAKLYVFDANSGERIAFKKLGTTSRSTPLVADGKIYYCTNSGQWYILKPTDDGVEIVHRLRLSDEEVDGSPIVSHGRIYLPTSQNLYCIGNAEVEPQADPLPPPPKEDPITDRKPAVLQLVPYDVLLAPGETHKYKVRLYNAKGQNVTPKESVKADYAIDGLGKISPDGTYTAPTEKVHQCALITCKLGGLTGTSRVRVIPPLPWKWDFNSDKDVSLTWIGGRVRYEIRDVNGERIIVKKSLLPIPREPFTTKLGTRSMMFMGPIDLANYTIQGDVQLPEENGKLSDVGLINSGYYMTIRGQTNKLRIDSWPSHDVRTHEMIDAGIKPGEWYTMKLSVVPNGETAAVRGKLWKRGDREPENWTIEMIDQAPNLHGSPGLYGHASDAEIYLDNLQVMPN